MKKVDKLIYDLIDAEDKPIDIRILFDKASKENFLVSTEFSYALSNLLANNIVSLDYDRKLSIKNHIK